MFNPLHRFIQDRVAEPRWANLSAANVRATMLASLIVLVSSVPGGAHPQNYLRMKAELLLLSHQRLISTSGRRLANRVGQSIAATAASMLDQVLRAFTDHSILGFASWYNPYRSSPSEIETASGELYDPNDWTAAIQTELRGRFGGVAFGKNYQPAYALVECANKQAIIKINDVGPLKPGRIIDLNEQAMRYFDPPLDLGLINVKITPLLGSDWRSGPVEGSEMIVNPTLLSSKRSGMSAELTSAVNMVSRAHRVSDQLLPRLDAVFD